MTTKKAKPGRTLKEKMRNVDRKAKINAANVLKAGQTHRGGTDLEYQVKFNGGGC